VETLNRSILSRVFALCSFLLLALLAVAICCLVLRSTPFTHQRISVLPEPTASLSEYSASETDDAKLFLSSLVWESSQLKVVFCHELRPGLAGASYIDGHDAYYGVEFLDNKHNLIGDEILIYHWYSHGFLWKNQQRETIPTRIVPPKHARYITVAFGTKLRTIPAAIPTR
jgi:hypothetical protein